MLTVEELKKNIVQLPEKEYRKLRGWLSERDWNEWDRKIEMDAKEGKLDLLERLCQQVEHMLPQLPEEKREDAAQDLDSFVKEATKEIPRRKWYELSAEGLIEAAKASAEMTAPVTATIKSILALLKAT